MVHDGCNSSYFLVGKQCSYSTGLKENIMIIALLLLLTALLLVLLAGLNVSHPRVQFGWLGLAAYIAYVILTVAHR